MINNMSNRRLLLSLNDGLPGDPLDIGGGDVVSNLINIKFKHRDDEIAYANQYFPDDGIFTIDFGNQKHKNITFGDDRDYDGVICEMGGTGIANLGHSNSMQFSMFTDANNGRPIITVNNSGRGYIKMVLDDQQSKEWYEPRYERFYFTFRPKTTTITRKHYILRESDPDVVLTKEYPDASDTFSKINLFFKAELYYGAVGKYDRCTFTIPKFNVDDLVITPYINNTNKTFGFCSQEYSKKITSWKYTYGQIIGGVGYIEFESTDFKYST